MKFRRLRRLVKPALLCGLLGLAATACAANAPQDAMAPDGPISRQIDTLFRPVFYIAGFVFVLVEGLILFAVFKFRDRAGREEPKQVHGNTKLELTWTLIPALLLAGISIPTVVTIFDLEAKHTTDEVRVKVVGHQWWWEYKYVGASPEVNTANELVIPINTDVFLDLESADVIHSFWVPKLAGKQDVVPGRTNTMRLRADKPGQTYLGQCAEFCSISHANMRLTVITKTPAEFDTWLKQQQGASVAPATTEEAEGKRLFMANACIQCHRIDGVEGASATTGPNLTHFGSRATFGAATYQNTSEELLAWILHARTQKPGVLMPNFDEPLPTGDPSGVEATFKQLTDVQARAIVAYLRSLA